MNSRMRSAFLTTMVAGLALAGCGSGSDSGDSTESSATSTPTPISTSSYETPVMNDRSITIAGVTPEDGLDWMLEAVNSAVSTIDIAMYEVDPAFTQLVDALKAKKAEGVRVRIMISLQLFPPTKKSTNISARNALRKDGFEVELSDPKFSYFHEKAIIVDAGTTGAKALVGDFNLAEAYFRGAPPYAPKNQAGTRGMGVYVTDPDDLKEIATYFDANWPPFENWPRSTRRNLVWSPAAPQYRAAGNGEVAIQWLIDRSRRTLDIYAQEFELPSSMLQPVIDAANRGVAVRIVGNKGTMNEAIPQLKEAGVEIRVDPLAKPGSQKYYYIHTKSMISDGGTDEGIAMVGSTNAFLDVSVDTERELGTMVTEQSQVKIVQDVFDRDFRLGQPASADQSTG